MGISFRDGIKSQAGQDIPLFGNGLEIAPLATAAEMERLKQITVAEEERLKALLMQAIEIIMDFKPDAAKRLLAKLYPTDPDDPIDDN
jgi:hypothetical protein